MLTSSLVTILTFIILLGIALLFLYVSIQGVRDEIFTYSATLLDKLRIRNDMVPNLIETVRKYTKNEEKLLEHMAQLKSKSWPIEQLKSEKVNVELLLTADLHEVWKLPQKTPELNVDTNFLSLKKEFTDLGKEIDQMTETYNQKIRSFNSTIGFVLLRPIYRFLGFKKLPIFEFEP